MDWDTFTDKLTTLGENVGRGLKRVFGSHTERQVRKLEPIVQEVAELEGWAEGLSAEDFKAQTAGFKEALAAGTTTLDEILPKAFALVREASRRTLGLRHFDVQIVGGVVLHEGKIAEMMTGEMVYEGEADQVIDQILTGDGPAALEEISEALSDEVLDLLIQAIELKPADRVPDGAEMAAIAKEPWSAPTHA